MDPSLQQIHSYLGDGGRQSRLRGSREGSHGETAFLCLPQPHQSGGSGGNHRNHFGRGYIWRYGAWHVSPVPYPSQSCCRVLQIAVAWPQQRGLHGCHRQVQFDHSPRLGYRLHISCLICRSDTAIKSIFDTTSCFTFQRGQNIIKVNYFNIQEWADKSKRKTLLLAGIHRHRVWQRGRRGGGGSVRSGLVSLKAIDELTHILIR